MKQLLFSLTKKDFKVQFFCAGGPGGQHQNKTASACRITHVASGAIGESREYKEQLQNKKAAFTRLTNSERFKAWHKLEVSRRLGNVADIEEKVEKMMQPNNLKIEIVDEKGKWVEEEVIKT